MKIKIVLILIVIFLAVYLTGCSEIKTTDSLNYSNLNYNLQDVFDKLDLNSENLNIFDLNSEGFMAEIDKNNNEILDFMLEAIDLQNSNGRIIDVNFQKDKSAFYEYENGKYDLNHDSMQTKNRINMKDFTSLLSGLDYRSILAEFENSNTDFYEIRTNGLFRVLNDNDFVLSYVCYEYSEGNLRRLSADDVKKLADGDYFLPVYLSIGEITDKPDSHILSIHNDNLSAIVLVRSKAE